MSKASNFLKTFGPGLLFASAAIGTSHLILSTQGGAHYGLIAGWVILIALLLKYPFFEFAPRYTSATGESLLVAYHKQGKWTLGLFILIIAVSMFAVTGAIASASAGLILTFLNLKGVSALGVSAGILMFSTLMLILGRYTLLDQVIKGISVVLFLSVLVAFIAVLLKGPITPAADFIPESMFEPAGIVVMVGLIGWMPIGLEASTMSSIWTIKKIEASAYHPTVKEALFDFNLGYVVTTILAFLFLVIGAFSVYGTGEKLVGNPVVFSNKLVAVFSGHIGAWSFTFVALAAFGAIYGTLITAMDGFCRSMIRSIRLFLYHKPDETQKDYAILMSVIAIGAFVIISWFGKSLGGLLRIATAVSFVGGPMIAYLNLQAIRSLKQEDQPPTWLMILAYVGLVFLTLFTGYYLWELVSN